MSWNYRVLQEGDNFFIGEAYYKEGKVVAQLEFDGGYSGTDYNPVQGNSVEHLAWQLEQLKTALNKPVLKIVKSKKTNPDKASYERR